jgi:Uma2 family endonuclease
MSRAAKALPPAMTVDEFLAWPGDGKQGKYELVDGYLRAMAPAQPIHSLILGRVGRLIGNHLAAARPSCNIYIEPAIRVRIREAFNWRIPDLGVTCTPLGQDHKALPDPLLLIEILSPSNAADTWSNVWAYTTIPTVHEILIVHSDMTKAELLRRGPDGNWPRETEAIGADGTINLATIAFDLPLIEVYRGTYLVAPDA